MQLVNPETGEVVDMASYKFDARQFALTWLTVASASSDDSERPILYRSVNVELDRLGVRLTSTDSYRFWAWWEGEVPSAVEPDYEDERGSNVTISDSDFRARDLMKYVLRTTKREDDPLLTIELAFGKAPKEDGQFFGMERDAVIFTVAMKGTGAVCESLVLPLLDAEYPDMRAIYNDRVLEPTDVVAFNPVLLTKMMKAVPGSEEMPCTLEFQGNHRAVTIKPWRTEDGWPLRGALMPTATTAPTVYEDAK